jgi:hypothetical protein
VARYAGLALLFSFHPAPGQKIPANNFKTQPVPQRPSAEKSKQRNGRKGEDYKHRK